MSRRVPNGERRISPTPSEQSFQTTVTNPASLFSISQADGISDSISLATTAGHDGLIWERHPRVAMPVGYTMVRAQPPGFLHSSVSGQSQHQSEMDLFEFLKEAQLEHYYTALTTHLKIRSVQQIKYVEDSDLSELGFSRPEQRRLRKYFKRECPQTTMGKLRKRLSRSTVGRVSAGSKSRDHQTDSELSPYHHSVQSNNVDEDASEWKTPNWNEDRAFRASIRSSRAPTRNDRPGSDSHGCLGLGKTPVYRIIDSDQVELGTSLGEGEFGRVYQVAVPPMDLQETCPIEMYRVM
ncbi:unnamed protein product [Echinostoma caproni]|uniref:non-specific protein-tyrosine kinase n=1 Tax=Echinostoma caproni TaxID=27848 RepID=A0A183B289_9TREM|nr:unnamed protein product [Echinostoma caproni]